MAGWEDLWRNAMASLASLAGHFPTPDWTFGGGTALMLHCEHRRSKDIDIFLRDPQYLTALSPRLNDHTEALTGRYLEQSNFLKLIFDGGEVDFIIAPSLTIEPYTITTVLGTETKTRMETPVEIVAKKVYFRPDEFAVRDVFDFAFVLDHDPRAISTNLEVLVAKSDLLSLRLERLRALGSFPARARAALDPLPKGLPYLESAMEKVMEFLGRYGMPSVNKADQREGRQRS
ncbi:MAG: nucleotidyl transferase AbiEii/AbiGii toxin family protein [Gammaproteobacteria bacterium]